MSTLIKSLAGLGLGAALTLTAGSALAAGGGGCGTFTNADGVVEHLAVAQPLLILPIKARYKTARKSL